MNQNQITKMMPNHDPAENNIDGIINNMLEHEHQSANTSVGVIITDEMIQEEINLENKAIAEEKRLQEKILEEEKKRNEEQCFKRLHLLLSKSSIYARFMAEKLRKHEQAEKKKEIKEQRKLKSLNDDKRLNDVSLKRSKTAKGGNKKIKCNVIDVYKKENMASMEFQECNDKNQKASANEDYSNYEHPKLFSGGAMRGYQIEGYEWLITLFENGVNGILADEMGLGKTIQCIAFIANMIEKGLDGPFFICGPLSTLPNWFSEFKRFTPHIPVILYHGEKSERETLRQSICKPVKCSSFMCRPVVITSFQIALNDCSKLRSIRWKLLVIDEAHRIKNFQCKLVMALKQFYSVHRLLLTGTPLQNNLSELWSLLNFILPEIFDDLNVFRSWFDINRLKSNGATAEIVAQEQEKQIVSTIHEILNPFLLRRTKADVQLKLPPKKEVIVHAPLSRLQQKYYADVLNNTIRKAVEKPTVIEVGPKRIRKRINYCELNSDKDIFYTEENIQNIISDKEEICHPSTSSSYFDTASNDVYVNIRNEMMILRRICGHPYLISYPLTNDLQYKIDEDLVKSSGKLMMLDIMLSELKKRGHKVLVFTQFVSMLNILQDYCFLRGHKYNSLYGGMNLQARDKEINEFNNDPNSFLFLISTRAGGLGINLVAADTVIIYDSDWNPQCDLQAQDRCHRIGQDKPVIVYRLVTPNTIDEHMVSTADSKRKLEKVIIKKGRFASKDILNRATGRLTKEEIIELLESSDVTKFKEFDENNIISPEDLNKLLDRSDMNLSSEDMKK